LDTPSNTTDYDLVTAKLRDLIDCETDDARAVEALAQAMLDDPLAVIMAVWDAENAEGSGNDNTPASQFGGNPPSLDDFYDDPDANAVNLKWRCPERHG
jgi:hypothetical protein